MSAPGTTARRCSRRTRSPCLRPKKPSKKKCSQGMPDETSAVTQAEGPGITSTGTSASRAASTSAWPGSDTLGMPASEAKGEGLPRQQAVDQAGGAAGDHILVATDKRLGNAQVHQQL